MKGATRERRIGIFFGSVLAFIGIAALAALACTSISLLATIRSAPIALAGAAFAGLSLLLGAVFYGMGIVDFIGYIGADRFTRFGHAIRKAFTRRSARRRTTHTTQRQRELQEEQTMPHEQDPTRWPAQAREDFARVERRSESTTALSLARKGAYDLRSDEPKLVVFVRDEQQPGVHVALGFSHATAARMVADLQEALGLPGDRPSPCEMVHQAPFDFGQCNAHDTTFPLGGACKWSGRESISEVLQEEADEQRGRAVRAEAELERIRWEIEQHSKPAFMFRSGGPAAPRAAEAPGASEGDD